MLEWDNGLEFADHDTTFLGGFCTAEGRDGAIAAYVASGMLDREDNPFYKGGKFVRWELELGKLAVPVNPPLDPPPMVSIFALKNVQVEGNCPMCGATCVTDMGTCYIAELRPELHFHCTDHGHFRQRVDWGKELNRMIEQCQSD